MVQCGTALCEVTAFTSEPVKLNQIEVCVTLATRETEIARCNIALCTDIKPKQTGN